MKKEQLLTIVLFVVVWGGSFIYSKGVTDSKIEIITENMVMPADFSAQQQRVDDLVVTVNKVVDRLDTLINMMIQQRGN